LGILCTFSIISARIASEDLPLVGGVGINTGERVPDVDEDAEDDFTEDDDKVSGIEVAGAAGAASAVGFV
jgi:hypothetical protein